jgi:hypothetical protein
MRKIAFATLMLALSAGLALAQVHVPKLSGDSLNAYTPITQKGLFDPSRFSMSNSYSMMVISDGKHSTYQNLYVNSSKYQLSNNLSLNLDLGYRFNSLATAKSNDRAFLPNAELRFTPNEHLLIQMSYHTLDPYFYGYGYSRSPWYR